MNVTSRPSKAPLIVGVVGTGIWLGLAAMYLLLRATEVLELKPNELGDFLAGTFAPLAFLWIVVGYLQQSTELRLQVEELSHQVAATRQMADAALTRQERESMAVRPILLAGGGAGKGGVLNNFKIENRGAPVTNFMIADTRGALQLSRPRKELFDRNDSINVVINKAASGWFNVTYTDGHQNVGSQWFYFDGSMRIVARNPGEEPLVGEELRSWLAENEEQ